MSGDSSDKELWAGIKNSDQEALTLLFKRYYFYLVKAGINYCQDSERARDAANDVFLHLWRNRQSLSEVDNVKAYLNTTFRNRIFSLRRMHLKNKDRLQQWRQTEDGLEFSYEELLVALQVKEERKESLRRAFSLLTPRQKEYLRLKFYEGLGYDRIAEQTGQTVKTIYNTVYEAIKALRSEMRG